MIEVGGVESGRIGVKELRRRASVYGNMMGVPRGCMEIDGKILGDFRENSGKFQK